MTQKRAVPVCYLVHVLVSGKGGGFPHRVVKVQTFRNNLLPPSSESLNLVHIVAEVPRKSVPLLLLVRVAPNLPIQPALRSSQLLHHPLQLDSVTLKMEAVLSPEIPHKPV